MFDCPHCGELVQKGATSCPHCGSDAETGWSADLEYYQVELPEPDSSHESRPQIPARVRQVGLCLLAMAAGLLLLTRGRGSQTLLITGIALFLGGLFGILRPVGEPD